MIIMQMKCQMCGELFEAKMLDRDEPGERHFVGRQVRCPHCDPWEWP